MALVILSILSFIAACAALVVAWRDRVTSRRQLEEMQQRVHEAQRLLRLRGMMASEMAHDIKNPLTAILCSAEALDLLIGDSIDQIHRQTLRYMKDYGENLLRLVGNFLDISRAESGHLDRRPAPTDVVELTGSVIGLLQAYAGKRRISLRMISIQNNLISEIDPTHLKQIVFNLVHNAIKFSREGGEVTIMVKSECPSPSILIEVSDVGVGIPEDKIRTIFDPYAHYDHSGVRDGEGLGLGLALCKTLTELEGGMIQVRSKVHVGSTFTLTIPMVESSNQPEELIETVHRDPKDQNQPLLGQRFLVVDEDLGSREAIAKLIEAWGGMVDRVAMATEAVEAIGRTEYDAVMVDETVDGVKGHELARLMREDLISSHTKIIVSSKERDSEPLAKEAGADGWIEKPLNGRVLLDSLLRSGKFLVQH